MEFDSSSEEGDWNEEEEEEEEEEDEDAEEDGAISDVDSDAEIDYDLQDLQNEVTQVLQEHSAATYDPAISKARTVFEPR